MNIKKLNTIKASILGLVFIAVDIYLLVKNITTDYYIIAGLLITGLCLFFVPDKFINMLERKILGREIKLFKEINNK